MSCIKNLIHLSESRDISSLETDLIHSYLVTKREVTIQHSRYTAKSQRLVHQKPIFYILSSKWDRSFQHIASISFSCWNKLQSTPLCHLYHLLQLIDFASLVPLLQTPNSLEST